MTREGIVDKREHAMQVLVPRQELTGADRSWAQRYQPNDVLHYSRTSKETGIGKGEYARVLAVKGQENLLTVLRGNGEQTTYDPRRQMGVSVYRAEAKAFSVGDRIQFTAPNQELKICRQNEFFIKGADNAGNRHRIQEATSASHNSSRGEAACQSR